MWLLEEFPSLCSCTNKAKIFLYSSIKLNFGNGLGYVRLVLFNLFYIIFVLGLICVLEKLIMPEVCLWNSCGCVLE
jgi:hypothetical protein